MGRNVYSVDEYNRKQHLHTGSGVILHSVSVFVKLELTLHTLRHYALTDLQENNTTFELQKQHRK